MDAQKITMWEVPSSYKLKITHDLLDKIKFLCGKLPNREWSGVLFYKPEGSFEDTNLVLTAVDLYLLDVGSAAATEFEITVDTTHYMVEHDLLDCQTGLIHSHHTMATFFSGIDKATLQKEGEDRNHFLSLIVNNEGTYSAKITRRVTYTEDTTFSYKYPSFDGIELTKNNLKTAGSYTVIEAVALVIEKEEVDLTGLKKDLERLQTVSQPSLFPYTKETTVPTVYENKEHSKVGSWKKVEDGDEVFINRADKWANSSIPYNTIFIPEQVTLSTLYKILWGSPFYPLKGVPSKKYLKSLVQDLPIRYNNDTSTKEEFFEEWMESYVEVILSNVECKFIDNLDCSPEEGMAIIAYNVKKVLDSFPSNKYQQSISTILDAYIL